MKRHTQYLLFYVAIIYTSNLGTPQISWNKISFKTIEKWQCFHSKQLVKILPLEIAKVNV